MITIRQLSKSFGTQDLFSDISLQINYGDRYALVGPNGAGKSTLFKMILGIVESDGGQIQLKKGVRIGYLPQETAPTMQSSVLAETLSTTPEADGRQEAEAKSILMGLGFGIKDFHRPCNTLSGGWVMRVALARLLVEAPDLLLLDEPTNHLDLMSLLWLEQYLETYTGAVFMISHDRDFINTTCRAIASIEDGGLKIYHGDYEYYLSERAATVERIESAYKQQQNEIAKLQKFVDENRARASSASRVQSVIKRMEKMEMIELPPETRKVKIKFPQPSRTGVKVLSLKNVCKSYGEITVYDNLNFELERGVKMAFVGRNGAGKSTLLKLLGGAIEPDSGVRELGLNVKSSYYSQHRSEMLTPGKTCLQEAYSSGKILPEMFVRTVLGTFLFSGDSVFKKVDYLSGGEKSRLALVKMLLDPANVLLLDEPTTHLDIASTEALADALCEFEGTICFISHDLYFINRVADHVLHVEDGKLTLYPGNYEYFERRQAQKQIEEAQEAAAQAASRPKPQHEPAKQAYHNPRSNGPSEKKMSKMLADIEKTKAQLAALSKKLEEPAIYSDFEQVRIIGEEVKELQARLEAQEQEFLSLG